MTALYRATLHTFVKLFESAFAGAILMREAARQSRRWQMYVARAAFSAVMMAVLLGGIQITVATPTSMMDKADMGWVGRYLFVAFAMAQVFMAVVLAPLMVAAAVVEEVEEDTLDLLVLTRLSPGQIIGAKVLSRILTLLTIVAGALPIMALVVTLGGVSTIEVVSVTVGTLVSVVILGSLGGFFALFTRSPMLSMMTAASYVVPMYIFLPIGYTMTAGDPVAALHFSPLMGSQATDWSALLPVLSYLPSLYLIFVIGRRLFALRIARANIRKAFSAETWGTRYWLYSIAFLIVSGLIVLPVAGAYNWAMLATKSGSGWMLPLTLLSKGVVWLWWVGAATASTWAFLRVGMDIVDVLDTLLGRRMVPRKKKKDDDTPKKKRKRRSRRRVVWNNPVAWWEMRMRAWGVAAVPLLIVWGLMLLFVFQSMLWVVPGGLLLVGGLNGLGAVIFSTWLASWSIVRERHHNTLDLVLVSTLPSWRIVLGKALGAALPTAPILALSLPMLVLGVPHLQAGFSLGSNGQKVDWAGAFAFGTLAWFWLVALWAFMIGVSMAIGLRVKNERTAFGLTLAFGGAVFGLPAVLSQLLPDVWLLTFPARLITPTLAGGASLWHLGASMTLLFLASFVLLAGIATHLRQWAVQFAVLFALLPLAAPAMAQAPRELQDDFDITVMPLGEGLQRTGHWTALLVRIDNHGHAARGRLSLDERQGDGNGSLMWQRPIELPEGARKEVTVLYKAGRRGGERVVTLTTRSARLARAVYVPQMLGPEDVALGVIGTDAMGVNSIADTWQHGVPGLRPRTQSKANQRRVRVGLMPEPYLPTQSAPLALFDQVIWPRADPTKLSEPQLKALRHYVADGGHLVITATDTWKQLDQASIADMLPVRLTGIRDRPIGPLAVALDSPFIPDDVTPVAGARVQPVAGRQIWTLASLDNGDPAWVVGTYGLGTVTFMAGDLRTAPLSKANKRDAWRRLLWLPEKGGPQAVNALQPDMVWAAPKGAHPADWAPSLRESRDHLSHALRLHEPDNRHCALSGRTHFDANLYGNNDTHSAWENHLRSKLSNIPGVAPLPMSWLLLFSGLYLLVIGPLDFFVLRAMRRQPLTWVTFPLSIVAFSATALIGTSMFKGSQAVVARVEVVDLLPGTNLWRGDTWLGVFATRKTDLTLQSGHEDATIVPLAEEGFMGEPRVHTSDGGGALSYRAETWTLGYSHTRWTDEAPGTVDFAYTEDGWEVTNNLPFDLEDAAIVLGWSRNYYPGEGIYPLGRLASGQTRAVEVSAVAQAMPLFNQQDDHDFAWTMLFEHLDEGRGHLDLHNGRLSLIGRTSTPIEPVKLRGLRPVDQALTVVRVPLTPTLLPNPNNPENVEKRLGARPKAAEVAKHEVRLVHLEIVDKGAFEDADVRPELLSHHRDVQHCYRAALQRNPKARGRVVAEIHVPYDGVVSGAYLSQNDLDYQAQTCLEQTLRQIRLPKPKNGFGELRVTWEFKQ